MNVTVRKYEEKDLPDLIRIWNEVVEDGVRKAEKFTDFTFFIRIISEDAVISVTPAMR